jgi:predicted transcriptional regulator
MKNCLQDEISEEGLFFNMIDESLKIIHQIDREVLSPKKSLFEKLNRPKKLINYLIEGLIEKGHVETKRIENEDLLSLTDKGKEIYQKFLVHFSSDFQEIGKKNVIVSDSSLNNKIPPFIGAFIADKDGRSLLKFETFDNALKRYILEGIPGEDSNVNLDLDLIPMFISAIEKFSLELNIQDLASLGLQGSNIKMNVFGFEELTVTVFMNPNVNLKPIEYKIKNYFKNLLKDYKKDFELSIRTGNLDGLNQLVDNGRKWLGDLNKSYEDMIINTDIFDNEHAKYLYNQIDELYNDINKELSVTLERVKKLKVNLMKSSVENNYDELKKIAKLTQELKSRYVS